MVSVGTGVSVGSGFGVRVAVGSGVSVGTLVSVGVSVGTLVSVGMGLACPVSVGTFVGVSDSVGTVVGVSVGVSSGAATLTALTGVSVGIITPRVISLLLVCVTWLASLVWVALWATTVPAVIVGPSRPLSSLPWKRA